MPRRLLDLFEVARLGLASATLVLFSFGSAIVHANEVSVTSAAALGSAEPSQICSGDGEIGPCGLEVVLDGGQSDRRVYVESAGASGPNSESRYELRFRFDPNSLEMADNTNQGILQLLSKDFNDSEGFVPALRVYLASHPTIGYRLSAQVFGNQGGKAGTQKIALENRPQIVTVTWLRASAGSSNGGVSLNVTAGEPLRVEKFDRANNFHELRVMRLGAPLPVKTSTKGSLYFDEVRSEAEEKD